MSQDLADAQDSLDDVCEEDLLSMGALQEFDCFGARTGLMSVDTTRSSSPTSVSNDDRDSSDFPTNDHQQVQTVDKERVAKFCAQTQWTKLVSMVRKKRGATVSESKKLLSSGSSESPRRRNPAGNGDIAHQNADEVDAGSDVDSQSDSDSDSDMPRPSDGPTLVRMVSLCLETLGWRDDADSDCEGKGGVQSGADDSLRASNSASGEGKSPNDAQSSLQEGGKVTSAGGCESCSGGGCGEGSNANGTRKDSDTENNSRSDTENNCCTDTGNSDTSNDGSKNDTAKVDDSINTNSNNSSNNDHNGISNLDHDSRDDKPKIVRGISLTESMFGLRTQGRSIVEGQSFDSLPEGGTVNANPPDGEPKPSQTGSVQDATVTRSTPTEQLTTTHESSPLSRRGARGSDETSGTPEDGGWQVVRSRHNATGKKSRRAENSSSRPGDSRTPSSSSRSNGDGAGGGSGGPQSSPQRGARPPAKGQSQEKNSTEGKTSGSAGKQPAPPKQIIIVLVGLPGSGKSYFSNQVIAKSQHHRNYVYINQDTLGSRKRCVAVAHKALSRGDSIIVDRCNFDVEQRAHWLRLARQYRVPRKFVFAVYLNVGVRQSQHGVMNRRNHPTLPPSRKSLRIVERFQKRFVPPSTTKEAFGCVLIFTKREEVTTAINFFSWL